MTARAPLMLLLCLVAAPWAACQGDAVPTEPEEIRMPAPTAPDELVIIGSMTDSPDEIGLTTFRLNGTTGELTPLSTATGMQSPGWLALDCSGTRLFAAGCVWNAGRVGAWEVDPATGALKLRSLVSSGGGETCHVALDADERFVACANYADGTAAVLPVLEDGGLGEPVALVRHQGSSANAQRQEASHPHSVTFTPDGGHLLVADLGTDKLMVYAFDPETGALTPAPQPWFTDHPGAGPRHLAFHPEGRFAYLANELDSTVTALAWDADAAVFTELQTLPMLPADFTGQSTAADIHVTPDGRFVYASNRGHDSLAIYAVDPATGLLTATGHQLTGGRTPRGFGLDPSGRWVVVANQDTDNVVVFSLDPDTGALTPTGCEMPVKRPCCVAFHVLTQD